MNRKLSVLILGVSLLACPSAHSGFGDSGDFYRALRVCGFAILLAGSAAGAGATWLLRNRIDGELRATQQVIENRRQSVEAALNKFRDEKGVFPERLEELPLGSFASSKDDIKSLLGGYLYQRESDGKSYRLTAK